MLNTTSKLKFIRFLKYNFIVVIAPAVTTTVVCGQPWSNILAYGGHGGRGVGVTVKVRLHRFVMGENGRRESGKIPRVGYLRRGIRI